MINCSDTSPLCLDLSHLLCHLWEVASIAHTGVTPVHNSDSNSNDTSTVLCMSNSSSTTDDYKTCYNPG